MTKLQSYIIFLTLAALPLLMLTACSEDKPDNFEPELEMLPASDITRTQAVVSARIHKHGSADLTHLVFRYGEDPSLGNTATVADVNAESVSVLLTGLKPGTTYSCCLEGGTATATLRSETIRFTTIPNDRPKVSQPVALSTGPTGIIIEFEITDDGGEPLTAAGCDLSNGPTGEIKRMNIAPEALAKGRHRLVIAGLTPLTAYTITPFAANTAGESKGEPLEYTTRNGIVLHEPGVLASLFEGYSKADIERLVISGEMNGDDFRFVRLLLGAPAMQSDPEIESKVSEIDLTDVNIVEGGGSYDGGRFTEADKITTGLFADCKRLKIALLPTSATVLARDAVAHCTALESLTIPAGIASLMPSEGCTSLRAIDVSPGNSNYASVDGVLFNHDCKVILWFPLGKTGTFTIPSTVTEIGENAFYGTRITGLVIPQSVTTIRRGAFAGSALTEITLPDNLANVSESMFQGCTPLTTVRLGKGTKYIGNYAFDGTSLKNLYVGATTPPFVATEAFYSRSSDLAKTCVLHVPAASKKIYRNHSKWGRFETIEDF